ncbi:unnamed protein product [Rotaria sordida]|uniref:Tetratricopeptide repeat protein n=1 Tax=Rotaria sordida TaxID=392033 RepID=A0A814RYV7_9BILA|nr:unnamed protein product [Rotaria sordida]CAF1327545.1 unnamed protein product [Rotaria sordida]CAF3674290.1 unnamed protein product [Rotaria sordida]CAF3675743.1 unnamed protein product [Rotaria sordida]
MYTKLIKEILLELEYNDQSLHGLITYCRDKYSNNQKEFENIQKFKQGYGDNSPRWWHTYECFHLSYVYTSMKKYPEAVTSYKRVVEIGPHVSPPRYQNLEVYKQNLESIRKKGNK